jgi:hypothetical protein
MRYLTLLVEPTEDGAFHPLGRQLTAEPSITRRAVHHVELLGDDTVLLLAEASGSRERYEEIMTESPHVVDHFTAGGDRWMAVSRVEPTAGFRRILELQRDSLLVVDTPISFDSEDRVKVTYLGSAETFRKLFDHAEEVESVTFDILDMGEYEVDESSFVRVLTARQEEVLETAVELGYYSEPRRASLDDISDAIGIAAGTVGEHLRKIEQRVFSEIVR